MCWLSVVSRVLWPGEAGLDREPAVLGTWATGLQRAKRGAADLTSAAFWPLLLVQISMENELSEVLVIVRSVFVENDIATYFGQLVT